MKQLLEKYSKAYYDGEPLISNEEYDKLEALHGQIIAGAGDIPHRFRMYSLKKHYSVDGEAPLKGYDLIESLKLDGAAISLTYFGGVLCSALTRGDGFKGMDLIDKVHLLPGVPLILEMEANTVLQIDGEVVANKNLPNSRNYASGALKQLSLNTFEERVDEGDMLFVVYNMRQSDEWGCYPEYKTDMDFLSSRGFTTILTEDLDDVYPTDGIVYRVNNNKQFNQLGFTDKFPRGAYAYKEAQEEYETVLVDVEWNTGKTGKVTPTAILEPVKINGATISRATLNNIEYIEALELTLGCGVKIIRAGEIIPKIVGKISHEE